MTDRHPHPDKTNQGVSPLSQEVIAMLYVYLGVIILYAMYLIGCSPLY